MGKIKRGLETELHKAETKGKKVLVKQRKGNFYLQTDNESQNGVKYINTIAVHKFGNIPLAFIPNFTWLGLVDLAKANLVKNKG